MRCGVSWVLSLIRDIDNQIGTTVKYNVGIQFLFPLCDTFILYCVGGKYFGVCGY